MASPVDSFDDMQAYGAVAMKETGNDPMSFAESALGQHIQYFMDKELPTNDAQDVKLACCVYRSVKVIVQGAVKVTPQGNVIFKI